MRYLLTGDVRVSIQPEDRIYASVYHTTTCKHTYVALGIARGCDLRFLDREGRAVEFSIYRDT